MALTHVVSEMYIERMDGGVGKVAPVYGYLFAEAQMKPELHSMHEEEHTAEEE